MKPDRVRALAVNHVIPTPNAMGELGAAIALQLQAGDLVALNGPLGAGKTTFTRGLGEALGVRGAVTSPTFVLARTHPRLAGGAPLVHVDAYRLNGPADLDDLDIDFDRSIVVVEWAAGMLDGVSDNWLEINIERPLGAKAAKAAKAASAEAYFVPEAPTDSVADAESDGIEPRRVTITGHGARWRELRLE